MSNSVVLFLLSCGVFIEMRIAVIDCGTNTFHLIIGEKSADGVKTLYQEKIPVKIGKGGLVNRTIVPEARQRALWALKRFAGIMEEYSVIRTTAIATSAFRNAKNGSELLKKIRRQTGIDLEIISGKKEAELIYEGVKRGVQLKENNSLIMDIGGGSVEFIIANRKDLLWLDSFEIGAQRLLDLFHKNDPITSAEIIRLKEYLKNNLSSLNEAISTFSPIEIIGSSGTFDTLVEIRAALNGNHPGIQTEYHISFKDFETIANLIVSKNKEERLQIPGMAEMRVDMIVVSILLITFVLNEYSIKTIRTSSYALKEGLLATTFSQILKTA